VGDKAFRTDARARACVCVCVCVCMRVFFRLTVCDFVRVYFCVCSGGAVEKGCHPVRSTFRGIVAALGPLPSAPPPLAKCCTEVR
jgi:hypothetical protein